MKREMITDVITNLNPIVLGPYSEHVRAKWNHEKDNRDRVRIRFILDEYRETFEALAKL